MSNVAVKTASNIFYKARCGAAKHNEQLSSREGAADIMSIDRGRLYRIESGIANPYPEEVHLMADLYNAPELKNYYCKHCCPLGADMPEVDVVSLDRIALKALKHMKAVSDSRETLIDICEDGIISEEERPQLDEILKELGELEQISKSLRVWVEKNKN